VGALGKPRLPAGSGTATFVDVGFCSLSSTPGLSPRLHGVVNVLVHGPPKAPKTIFSSNKTFPISGNKGSQNRLWPCEHILRRHARPITANEFRPRRAPCYEHRSVPSVSWAPPSPPDAFSYIVPSGVVPETHRSPLRELLPRYEVRSADRCEQTPLRLSEQLTSPHFDWI